MNSFDLFAVIALVILAFGDLMVGVANDAVNFLNPAIGAKAAKLKTILLVSSVGMIIGATFSDGIIEVARKGIFNPDFFTAHEAILIFTAVAITDIILLDFYSTFGLPTSTTVSIVFELFGAALVLAIAMTGSFSEAWTAINSSSAVKIIIGIVLSVGIAFVVGLIIQFVTRLVFTFHYEQKMRKFGFAWAGIALSCLTFFILVKGGEHASFFPGDLKGFISANVWTVLGGMFVLFSAISYLLIKANVNVLKVIILVGTGALAMAFAGNDLANFIGVSVAGVNAFLGADLSGKLPTPTWVLLGAGLVMTFTVFTSKKSRTVVTTSVNLGSHEKDVLKQWKSNFLAEKIVDGTILLLKLIPQNIKSWISKRWEGKHLIAEGDERKAHDLIRASVILMVSAALISYATSQKLPLSTTYVTFIVAMGASLADGAWDRTCAPSRLAGIATVISGWFVTAFMAFIGAGISVAVLYFAGSYGLGLLVIGVGLGISKLLRVHKRREAKA